MEYEEKLLNGLLHWKDNPTGKWICFDKIELVSKVRFLQKENRKLEMIIKEGLGPEDLKRDI